MNQSTENKPKVSKSLWDAMESDMSVFHETTEDMFYDMLGCVPPIRQRRKSFLVGEASYHNKRGEALFACFLSKDGRFYAKYMTLREFDAN